MKWITQLMLTLAAGVTWALGAAAQPHVSEGSASPEATTSWKDLGKKHGLSEAELQRLEQIKFIIGGPSVRQAFTPYIGGDVPVFITADSLLNGFHVLFEESVLRMEQANARKLPKVLGAVWNELGQAEKSFPGDSKLLTAARKRASLFLGTARHLLDAQALPDDAALKSLIEAQVNDLVRATGSKKPAWLGAPDPGFLHLDYTRFKPRGFYTKNGTLQRYFRAVAWLQAIPFRLERDEEFVALLLMHRAQELAIEKKTLARGEFWDTFRVFLGQGDDWDLRAADAVPQSLGPKELERARAEYRQRAKTSGPQINDQIAFPNEKGKPEIGFRFLSAYRLPDSALFQRTTQFAQEPRDFPSGLEVAAILGSPFARKRLAQEHPLVLKEVEKLRPNFELKEWLSRYGEHTMRAKGLYFGYLHCLGVLLERTEPDAPKFMHSEAWQARTCQTALGGWAQMRHTWALQGKMAVTYLSKARQLAGFVEPVPEFYHDFALLLKATRKALDEADALTRPDVRECLEEIRAFQQIFDKVRKKDPAALNEDEKQLLSQAGSIWSGESGKKLKERLDNLAKWLDHHGLDFPANDSLPEELFGFAEMLGLPGIPQELSPKWDSLIETCRALENLAHKQLRQVAFSEAEEKFLKSYGTSLANVMLYGGNSYFHPRDDAPRVIDVFTNASKGRHLLVGIARPRYIWVLYPFKGEEVLCRGAALPYHEFAHGQRLNDAEWKQMLDSPQCPAAPQWLQPLLKAEKNK